MVYPREESCSPICGPVLGSGQCGRAQSSRLLRQAQASGRLLAQDGGGQRPRADLAALPRPGPIGEIGTV
eukprot:5234716-Pyramimonas_sp.AAC.1